MELKTQFEELMTSKEGEHLEFKEAGKSFHFETLVKYCAALANEGGGKIVLGVTDNRPRSVVGSQAFKQPERTRSGLLEQLHLNIDFSIVNHPNGRVLIFHVPTHPIGNPIIYKVGRTRAALWYPGSETDAITSRKMVKRNPDAM